MDQIFGLESKFREIMVRFCDLMLLNLLFILTSLPVITIGASLTALYQVTAKMEENKESYVAKDYIRAWKQNFASATGLFAVLTALSVVLALEIRITMGVTSVVRMPMLLIQGILVFVLLLYWLFGFQVLARKETSLKELIRYIPLLVIARLPHAFISMAFSLSILLFLLVMEIPVYYYMLFFLFIGVALYGYCKTLMYKRMLHNMKKDNE